jgi:hypothetical protein
MRLPAEKIKQAILHPDEEVRVTAVEYFSDSYSSDPEIMPLVIQAVEKYGRDSAFRILRDAERLVQTPSTLDWLVDQLRGDFDFTKIYEDNVCFATSLVILAAPVDLLVGRRAEIEALGNFPEELRSPLEDRLTMASWTWDQSWAALEELGRKTMSSDEFSWNDNSHAARIVKALAQHVGEKGDTVLAWLRGEYPSKRKRLTEWLTPEIIDLAGEMRLKSAIPILVEHLSSEDLSLADSATTALIRIGTDATVKAIAKDWEDGSNDFRGSAADVLDKIHTDLSERKCLEFLDSEEEFDTAFSLASAVLSHFSFDGTEPIRDFLVIDEEEWTPEHYDLKYHLVAAATIMGEKFPEYDAWHQDALKENWGWGDTKLGDRRMRLNWHEGAEIDALDSEASQGELAKALSDQVHHGLPSVLDEGDESDILPLTTNVTIGRNAPCPCGSGKKYKKCCMIKDEGFEEEQ